VVFNMSELHKGHVPHHWRLLVIPMISQQVKYTDERTLANCHLCNHPFQNLYEIKETGAEEKALFAAAARKHQAEADRDIGGVGTAATATMVRDALLSTALYVCLACAAPVSGARYQRRQAQKIVQMMTNNDAHATAALNLIVALAGVGRVLL